MVERKEKRKIGTISEEDISTLLERYPAKTILTLLREVAQVSEARIDWKKMVENTATGISNAQEYQMLWRNLAYRHTLMENMDGADPLDDDSDLEFEIEPFPSVNSEALNEATALVKVLIAAGIPSESDIPNSSIVETPLTIGISSSQSSRTNFDNHQSACLMQGTVVTIPISIQRHSILTPEVSDVGGAVGGSASASRKKRKPWSKAEDMELIAAVQKCGEGNWANILKGDFKGDRTASQLSQRWSIIRKRRGKLNAGANATSAQISKAQIDAAHRALSFALDLPVNNSKAASSSNNIVSSASAAEAPVQMQNQSQIPMPTRPVLVEPLPSAAKSATKASKNSLMKSTHNSDSMVRATAVAAGARIVSPSDAASLLKAAQTKNAIHIKSNGASSSIKSPVLGNAPMHSDAQPTVHYISTGKTSTPGSKNYVGGKPNMVCNNSVKPISPKVPHNCSPSAILMNLPSDQRSPATESPLKQEVKSSGECKIPEPIAATPRVEVQQDEAVLGNANCNRAQEENHASQRPYGESRSLSTCIENHYDGSSGCDIKAEYSKQVEMEKNVNDVEMIRDSPDIHKEARTNL